MNRYLSERLMTVEEAEHLSRLQTDRDERKPQNKPASLWAWQSLDGALMQTVTEEQVDRAMRTLSKR